MKAKIVSFNREIKNYAKNYARTTSKHPLCGPQASDMEE